MKNGHIEAALTLTEEELAEINKFTRRDFTADELYTFSVILCDNDVDRDFERFTVDALKVLAELFVGKTGIADHSNKASDQCARIFSCELVQDEQKKNAYGEPYTFIKAKAYMPRTEKSKDLITEIDAGIKKEVSVGCAISERKCSICGGEAGACNHKKGRHYRKNGTSTLCSHELCAPRDAYEWSFVAVPAQRGAGVTKKSEHTFKTAEEIIKSIKQGNASISPEYSAAVSKYIDQLEEKAATAEKYLELQKAQIISLVCDGLDDSQSRIIRAALARMSGHELFALYKASSERSDSATPQLYSKKAKNNTSQNKEFII